MHRGYSQDLTKRQRQICPAPLAKDMAKAQAAKKRFIKYMVKKNNDKTEFIKPAQPTENLTPMERRKLEKERKYREQVQH